MVECEVCKALGVKPPKKAVAQYFQDIDRDELTFVCEEHKELAEQKGFVLWQCPNEGFNKPVLCPHCSEPLTTVQVERVTVLEYREPDADTEDENEFVDNGQGGVTARCHKCGKEIGHSDANNCSGIFPHVRGSDEL
jgi:hypothetical protein